MNYFTGTAAEVVPIKSVDESLIADGKGGRITIFFNENILIKFVEKEQLSGMAHPNKLSHKLF